MRMPSHADAVTAGVHVAVVLFGVEDSEVVVGLQREDVGSTIAFKFPTKPVVPRESPEDATRFLVGELVANDVAGLSLIGVHWAMARTDRDPVLLVTYAGACKGRPLSSRGGQDLQFGRVKPLRRKYPEFLKPHDQVLRGALRWIFRVVQETPVVADMCRPRFTIAELREVYGQVWGIRHIDPSNFHKQVTKPALGFVRKVEDFDGKGPGKPAALYEPGPARVLNPPIRPPHGEQTSPSIRVWGRDRRGRLG